MSKSASIPHYECATPGIKNSARLLVNEQAREYRKGGSHEAPAFNTNTKDNEAQFLQMKKLMDDEARLEKNKKIMAASASKWTKEDYEREDRKFWEARRIMDKANAAPNEPSYQSLRMGVSKQPEKVKPSKQVFPKPYYFQ